MKFSTRNKVSVPIIVTLFILMTANNTSATVGGPTTIDKLSYKASENSIYYVRNDGGGRGCPPIIEKIDLLTKSQIQVKTCEEIESIYYKGENATANYDQFIEDAFDNTLVKTLPTISFPNNNISIVVDYIGERKIAEYNTASDFRATIFQDSEKRGVIDFVGCYKDQPNVFKGYIIPDTNKMVVEVSRVGDCFEGGYIRDDVYVIEGINHQDTNSVGYYNYFSEPGVHRGNLVVFAQDDKVTNSTSPEIQVVEKNIPVSLWWTLSLIAGLIFGFLVGYRLRGKYAPR